MSRRGHPLGYLSSISTDTPRAKSVLFLISGFLLNGQVCRPRQTYMADKLGCHRRTIIRAIQELERLNLVVKTRRGRGRSNMYWLPKWLWGKLVGTARLSDLRNKRRPRSNPAPVREPTMRGGGWTSIGDALEGYSPG